MKFGKGWEPPADTAVHCAFCLRPAPDQGATRCRRCKVVYHPDCWAANSSRCAVYGCEPVVLPPAAEPAIPERAPTTSSSFVGRYTWLICLGIMALSRAFSSSHTSRSTPPKFDPPRMHQDWTVQRQSYMPPDGMGLKFRDPDGTLENTVDSYTRALARNPRSVRALQGRAFLEYDRQEWRSSLADFREALRMGGLHDDYVRFRIWMIEARTSDRGSADVALAASLNGRFDGAWEGWIGSYLLGRTSETDLLRQANSGSRTCQALYYMGTRHLIDGDRDGARSCFLRCADTREENYREYHSALAELQTLR